MGNTAAISRKCYVHPALLDAYSGGTLKAAAARRRSGGLSREETTFLGFLRGRKRRRTRFSISASAGAPAARAVA
jgi:DNA topoisomerase-1